MGGAYGYDENKNKVPMTPPPNDVLNGDFQCNQRGQSSYQNISGDVIYTVDKWYVLWGKVEVLPIGVKISSTGSGAYFQQIMKKDYTDKQVFITIEELNGTKHSANGTVNNSKGITLNKSNIKIDFSYDTGRKKYKLNIMTVNQTPLELKYVRVNENIAYEHQKEDYETALMRVEKNVIQISNILNGFTDATGKFITIQCDKLINMEGTPIVIGILSLILRIEGSESKPTAISGTVKKETGEIVLTLGTNYSSIASKTISGRFENKIIVSSEPL